MGYFRQIKEVFMEVFVEIVEILSELSLSFLVSIENE